MATQEDRQLIARHMPCILDPFAPTEERMDATEEVARAWGLSHEMTSKLKKLILKAKTSGDMVEVVYIFSNMYQIKIAA